MKTTASLILSLIFGGAVTAQEATSERCNGVDTNDNSIISVNVPEGKVSGIFLLVHGLNTNPSRMSVFSDIFEARGAATITLRLTGHRGDDLDKFRRVRKENWLQDFNVAYCKAEELRAKYGVPLNFVAHSLGTLLVMDYIVTNNIRNSFERIVLFSPGMTPRWYVKSVLLYGLLGGGYVIKSRAPAAFRANYGTPVNAYRALYSMIDDLENSLISKRSSAIINIPTVVFTDPYDKLVDYDALEEWVSKYQLSNWKIVKVSVNGFDHHQTIFPESYPDDGWNSVLKMLNDFLF